MALRWGVSGTGDIVHKAVAPALLAQPDSELVSFFSRSAERAAATAAKFGARRSASNFDAFVGDPELDAVYVAGEVDRHCPETLAALEAGKHVVVEKPMALDVVEARRMIDAAEAHGAQLAVAYYRRYYPMALKLKELLNERAIGRVLQASLDMATRFNVRPEDPKYWRVRRAAGGGALMDIASHRLDLLCWLLGEPAQVAGFCANMVNDWEVPDTETLLVRFQSGAHLTCRTTWAAGANQDQLTLVGSDGALLIGALEETRFILKRGRLEEIIEVEPVAANRHLPLLDDITRRLLAGEPLRHDGRAGLQATRIMDGCYRSHASGLIIGV